MGYVWSPLAPSPSGIANYAETLIASDPDLHDLTFVAENADQRSNRRAVAPVGDVWSEDRALLQLGNNVHHSFVLERARRGGAIVELHDLSLHHLHTELTLAQKDFPGYLAGLEESEGAWGRRAAFQRSKGYYTPKLDFFLRVNRAICERAQAVIVHSEWARFQIEIQEVETPVHVVPHYALTRAQSHAVSRSKAEARARLGLAQSSFVVLVAGYVTPAKRVDWVLDAFEQLMADGAELELVIAGACEMDTISARIEDSAWKSKIRVTGYVSDRDFDEYTLAADVLPVMRFPSAGESSGVAARAIGFGKVVIVPEYAAFSDIPDEISEKIYLDQPVVPQLVEAIQKYVEDQATLDEMERNVLTYAEENISLDVSRARLKSVLAKYWD